VERVILKAGINQLAEASGGPALDARILLSRVLRVPRNGRRNYPVNARRPAGQLITSNLPVSRGQKQVPHKFSPDYAADAIMTTKFAQINYARMYHRDIAASRTGQRFCLSCVQSYQHYVTSQSFGTEGGVRLRSQRFCGDHRRWTVRRMTSMTASRV